MNALIPRAAAPLLAEIRAGYPVITLTGPRLSGKTTLARAVFADKPYVSLEQPGRAQVCRDRPRAFWRAFPAGITTRCSTCPTCVVDPDRGGCDGGMGVSCSPARRPSPDGQHQSEPGRRSALVQLLPLSAASSPPPRACRQPQPHCCARRLSGAPRPRSSAGALVRRLTHVLLERDVRQITQVHDFHLPALSQALRGAPGSCSPCQSGAGNRHRPEPARGGCRCWRPVRVFLLPPHHRNLGSGWSRPPSSIPSNRLAASLLGLTEPAHWRPTPWRGAVRTLIVAEFLKARFNAGGRPISFSGATTPAGGGSAAGGPDALLPVEIKATATVRDELFAGLRKWQGVAATAGSATGPARLVCAAPESYQRNGVSVRRWQDATA